MSDEKPLAGHYLIEFQCPNCGEIFSRNIQKGVAAAGRAGMCPNCGCRDGDTAHRLGEFKVVRKNESKMFDGRQILLESPPFFNR